LPLVISHVSRLILFPVTGSTRGTTKSMEQSPFRQADSHSDSQEIPLLLCNPKVHHRVHKNPTLFPILSQMNPVYAFPPYVSKTHSNINLPPTLGSSERRTSSSSSSSLAARGYGLDDRMIGRFDSRRGWEFFSSPPRPERLWDPPSLLSSEYRVLFPWGKSDRGVKLTTHLHLVWRSNNAWRYTSTPNTPS
jgi:hypothetical protein